MVKNKDKKRSLIIVIVLIASLLFLAYTAVIGIGSNKIGSAKNIKLGLDLSGGVAITYQVVGDATQEEISDTVYKLQQRVSNYSTEASVYQEGNNRINIEIPGITNADEVLENLGKPGSLAFTLADDTELLTGADVVSAEVASQRDNMGNPEYVVSLEFSKEGKDIFAEATTNHVGESINIVYDGETISSPVVCLELVVLNAFDITLTLAGIAGVVLSIGMAVDANVIIYARIKEEITKGVNIGSAIDSGFKKALSAIIDGNITTLIAALVLNFMATGSVKGFAQTLGIGIIVSMFTACIISKFAMKSIYYLGVNKEKYFGKITRSYNFDFIKHRKKFIAVAILCIIIGPVFMLINKVNNKDILNLGLDFKGGTSTSVVFDKDYSIQEIDDKIKPIIADVTGDVEIQAQKVSGTNEIVFKTKTLTLEERENLSESLNSNFASSDGKDLVISYETISSVISKEMRSNAIIAVIVAVCLMLVYIWIRFSNIRFAGSAVLALVHDVLVVLSCYALMRISVGNTFIACMLTIVGYSINATIVIFDRIRENRKVNPKWTLEDIVNKSISQTLTRSIYTSLTTLIMVAFLFIFGVASIKEFALPLMVGIIAGMYSSVCLTGCIWYLMTKQKDVVVKKVVVERSYNRV